MSKKYKYIATQTDSEHANCEINLQDLDINSKINNSKIYMDVKITKKKSGNNGGNDNPPPQNKKKPRLTLAKFAEDVMQRFDQQNVINLKILNTLENINYRLTNVENRLTNLEADVKDLKTRMTNVEQRLDKVEQRLDNIESRLDYIVQKNNLKE